MDISRLKRDPDKVNSNIIVRGNEMVTKVPCKILVPARYIEQGLGVLEPEVYVIAIYAIVMEDSYYAVSSAPSMMRLTPTDINHVTIDDVEYVELIFPKGAVVCPQLNLVMRNEMVYYVYNELTSKGNYGWWCEEDDMTMPFENAEEFCGVRVGSNHAIMQMVASSCTRLASDKSIQFRHAVKTPADEQKLKFTIIPLRSIIWGPTNTFARAIGPYFKEGLTTALVNPSTKSETIEETLRG
jgi:hypothetical protein